jgi:hypothetical protein
MNVMADDRARALYAQRNMVGLFQYLGPMWMKVLLETLDDLTDQGFYPHPVDYEPLLRQAGVDVGRMQCAMAAVIHKRGHSITWGKYWEMYRDRLTLLPATQHGELRNFWFAEPKPGLAGPGDQAAPTVGNSGEWFVTAFGGTTTSMVVTVGFTAIEGTIEFTRADGTKTTKSIGVIGPTLGVSMVPGGAKVAERLAKRFPVLEQIINPASRSHTLSDPLIRWLTYGTSVAAKTFASLPFLLKYAPRIAEMAKALGTGGSFGPASLPSPAVGWVIPQQPDIGAADFSGSCVLFGLSGTFGAGPSGNVGVYGLAFGMEKSWNPITDPALNRAAGFAVISSASVSFQAPTLSAGESVMWGEIV